MKNCSFTLRCALLLFLMFGDAHFLQAYDFEVDGIFYNILPRNRVEVTYGEYDEDEYMCYHGVITIPETVRHFGTSYSVVKIGDCAFEGTEVTGISIPNSITTIGESAFAWSSLTSVSIPKSVTTIGTAAFSGCDHLTEINIQNATIGDEMFALCNGLTEVTIPAQVLFVGISAFSGCENLSEITIQNSVIGDDMFDSCEGLRSVTIPQSVTTVGSGAFRYCYHLTEINIQNSVIGEYMFYACNSLSSITIPQYVTSVGDGAFVSCDDLTEINIQNSEIGDYMFVDCNSLTSITIPQCVTSVGDGAFRDCESLTEVNILNSVIGNEMFAGCKSLSSMTIPEQVTSIGRAIFANSGVKTVYFNVPNCPDFEGSDGFPLLYAPVETLVFGDNVKSIPAFLAFQDYDYTSKLKNVTIPNSVTSIGKYAFERCTGLTSITIPESVTTIGASAFHLCTGLTSITIPKSVTTIGINAFEDCSGLSEITILNSTIGDFMFSYCNSLAHVTIPEQVTHVGAGAFSFCSALKSLEYNAVSCVFEEPFMPEFKLAANGTLSSFPSLKSPDHNVEVCEDEILYMYSPFWGSPIESVVVGENVELIPDYFLLNNYYHSSFSFSEITLPSSVKNIGKYAFYGCSDLMNVNCMAETPPAMVDQLTFDYTCYQLATLQVPEASVESYKVADWWRLFANISSVHSNVLRGDADGDGEVSIADVILIIDYLLVPEATDINLGNADGDLDGEINIGDIVAISDYIMRKAW